MIEDCCSTGIFAMWKMLMKLWVYVSDNASSHKSSRFSLRLALMFKLWLCIYIVRCLSSNGNFYGFFGSGDTTMGNMSVGEEE
ncbi:hypothetical protein GLYMA_13G162100v4 [Glycine max]|uniref:Uncharacterized protein n=1 Tax=Glycine max TaxID=3847 RepID=A0A0R0GP46_SOYBN|nr:hypothetical protein GYH30_036411 [Glycine max]KRH20189.1 hypothetical protein GLYMA_13G162100v4 [Glycine max]